MFKKFFMIALAITMIFVLVACKSATNEDFHTPDFGYYAPDADTDSADDTNAADINGDWNSNTDAGEKDDVTDGAKNFRYRERMETTISVVPGKDYHSADIGMIGRAYDAGEWDGTFAIDPDHCYSIDEYGVLWVDCQETPYYPDIPGGKLEFDSRVLGRTEDGTWVFDAQDNRIKLYSRYKFIAESDQLTFTTFEEVVNDGETLTVTAWEGDYRLELIEDRIIPMSAAPFKMSVAKAEEIHPDLLQQIQHLYYQGYWGVNGNDFECFKIVNPDGEVYFVAYDGFANNLIVNNEEYDVNLDVPVASEHVIGDWGIDGKYAILYDMGEVRTVLTMPAEIEEIVTSTDDSIIFMDRNSNLWHVSEETTVKVATRVCDTAGVNGFIAYLRADGTAYTYSVWDDVDSVKLCANATDVDFYGDFGFGAVVTEEESNLSYDGAYVFVELPPVPEVPEDYLN